MCGKNHSGECLAGKERCFGCGQSGHMLRDCLIDKVKEVEMVELSLQFQQHQQVTQLSRLTHLVQVAGQHKNRLYALHAQHDHEGSPNVVTGMLPVFDLDVYALLYLGDTFSFVTP